MNSRSARRLQQNKLDERAHTAFDQLQKMLLVERRASQYLESDPSKAAIETPSTAVESSATRSHERLSMLRCTEENLPLIPGSDRFRQNNDIALMHSEACGAGRTEA